VEAKNQNQDSLHKKDAGQLLLSLNWFSKNYPTRPSPQPIIVAKVTKADKKAGFPDNTRIITPAKMALWLDNIERFYQSLVQGMPNSLDPKQIAQRLPQFSLAPEQFLSNHTEPIAFQ